MAGIVWEIYETRSDLESISSFNAKRHSNTESLSLFPVPPLPAPYAQTFMFARLTLPHCRLSPSLTPLSHFSVYLLPRPIAAPRPRPRPPHSSPSLPPSLPTLESPLLLSLSRPLLRVGGGGVRVRPLRMSPCQPRPCVHPRARTAAHACYYPNGPRRPHVRIASRGATRSVILHAQTEACLAVHCPRSPLSSVANVFVRIAVNT